MSCNAITSPHGSHLFIDGVCEYCNEPTPPAPIAAQAEKEFMSLMSAIEALMQVAYSGRVYRMNKVIFTFENYALLQKAAEAIECAASLKQETPDNPELDATDGAHPAWWRGHDHATKVFCQKVNEILDGKDDVFGVASEPWESTRRRLLKQETQPPKHKSWCDSLLQTVENLGDCDCGASSSPLETPAVNYVAIPDEAMSGNPFCHVCGAILTLYAKFSSGAKLWDCLSCGQRITHDAHATKQAETPAAMPELPTDVELLTKRCLWQWRHIADLEATVKAHAERIHNQRIEIKRLATPEP